MCDCSEIIGAGGLGGEGGLVHWDPVVSAHCQFGGDFPGPDPVSDRLRGHSEESGGFCGGDVFGVHESQQYTRAQSKQGLSESEKPGPGGMGSGLLVLPTLDVG